MKSMTLREARERRDLTQIQLQELSGVTQGTISKIERGSPRPSHETVKRLEEALGLRRGTLVFGQEVAA